MKEIISRGSSSHLLCIKWANHRLQADLAVARGVRGLQASNRPGLHACLAGSAQRLSRNDRDKRGHEYGVFRFNLDHRALPRSGKYSKFSDKYISCSLSD